MTTCSTCAGLGRVFSCPLWPGCDCPDGTTRPGCPGVPVACECNPTIEDALRAFEGADVLSDEQFNDPGPAAPSILHTRLVPALCGLGMLATGGTFAAMILWW